MNGRDEWVPIYTADQVRRAERPLLDAGVPLMLWAATALASVIADELIEPGVTARLKDLPRDGVESAPLAGRLLVLAGRGDNGGDALYAAAALLQWTSARASRATTCASTSCSRATPRIGQGSRRPR